MRPQYNPYFGETMDKAPCGYIALQLGGFGGISAIAQNGSGISPRASQASRDIVQK
jgi:hypothetical protein